MAEGIGLMASLLWKHRHLEFPLVDQMERIPSSLRHCSHPRALEGDASSSQISVIEEARMRPESRSYHPRDCSAKDQLA